MTSREGRNEGGGGGGGGQKIKKFTTYNREKSCQKKKKLRKITHHVWVRPCGGLPMEKDQKAHGRGASGQRLMSPVEGHGGGWSKKKVWVRLVAARGGGGEGVVEAGLNRDGTNLGVQSPEVVDLGGKNWNGGSGVCLRVRGQNVQRRSLTRSGDVTHKKRGGVKTWPVLARTQSTLHPPGGGGGGGVCPLNTQKFPSLTSHPPP